MNPDSQEAVQKFREVSNPTGRGLFMLAHISKGIQTSIIAGWHSE